MDYDWVLEELYSLKSSKFKLGLKNIKLLLKKLGNPEQKLRCIHVAGTNGKGSVCAMISSILADAGCKIGMYTSPHLKKFNERIRINDKLITDKEIVEYYLRVKNHVGKQSFFEITTSMMFLYFYDKKVDFAVLEVGMGGRLDATNVVSPLISVITNIGLEHTDFLGDSIKKIAFEKASIIKKNIPVVTGAKGLALKTIKEVFNKKNSIKQKKHLKSNNKKKSQLFLINNKDVVNKKYNGKIKCWSFDFNNNKNLFLNNLKGEFQLWNAAIAVKTINILKNSYNLKINKNNIKNGLKNAKWPGRFQFIEKNILVDCAHNPDGFKILANELKNIKYKRLILVVGFLKDKDIKKISEIINPKAYKTIIAKPKDEERAADTKIVKKYFGKNSIIMEDAKKALKYAKRISGKKDLILVAGSIYVVGGII